MPTTLPVEKRRESGKPTETGWWYKQSISHRMDGTVSYTSEIAPVHVKIYKNGKSRVDFRQGSTVDGNPSWRVKYRWFGPVTVVEEV